MIIPMNDWMVVKPLDVPSMYGGIHTPAKYQKTTKRGMIIALCPDNETKLEVGHVIIYHKESGIEVMDGRNEFLFLKVGTILGQEIQELQDEVSEG